MFESSMKQIVFPRSDVVTIGSFLRLECSLLPSAWTEGKGVRYTCHMTETSYAPRTARERLVVALDVETGARALDLVSSLRGTVGMFKVGKQLFTAEGPDLVRRVVGLGERVFLDLKYHDIPATVAKACAEATRLGVSILNVHASGGREMLREAA